MKRRNAMATLSCIGLQALKFDLERGTDEDHALIEVKVLKVMWVEDEKHVTWMCMSAATRVNWFGNERAIIGILRR